MASAAVSSPRSSRINACCAVAWAPQLFGEGGGFGAIEYGDAAEPAVDVAGVVDLLTEQLDRASVDRASNSPASSSSTSGGKPSSSLSLVRP